MRKILSIIAVVVWSLPAFSQVVVEGSVYDSETSEPIAYAHVFVKGTEDGTITNNEGYFSLEVDELPVVLVVSEVAHQTRFVRAVEKKVEVLLEPFSLELEGVTIRDRGEPYFKMANHVLDFEFYDDLILLLGNSGREVRLIDHRGNVVERTLTPGKFNEIFKDCLNNLHLVNEDTAWQVFYDYEDIRFIHPHEREIFERYLRNCESRYNNGLIYSMGRKRGLVTTFLFAAGGATMPFYEIGDTTAIDYLETEYDLNYFIDERKNGNMRYAMSVDEMKQNLEQLQAELQLDWMDSRIIHPSAYYVFPEGKDLRVFSLGIMTEFRFNALEGTPKKQLIPLPEEHLDFMTRDEANDKIYAVYRSSMGKVWAMPLDNPTDRLEIGEYAFPSSIKVRNDHIFFINDPAIDGSNYLFRKNTRFGQVQGEY